MGYTVIAPVGDNTKAIFVGMKEFPTQKVILLSSNKTYRDAQKLAKKLDEFTIPAEIMDLGDMMLPDMFRAFGEIVMSHDPDELIVNVATGDRISTCAAISASYANGLKAIHVVGDKVVMLPIMKLSYYTELSDNKMRILNELSSSAYRSLKELSAKLRMSISLLSYHINGNFKHKGLKQHRLIEVKEEDKNLLVRLSQMGSMLLQGYTKRA